MFVRWKRCVLQRSLDTTLKVFLVRSVRVAGRPRQQTVCYLAAIRAQYQHAPAHRQAFWRRVEERLARLPLDAATRQQLEHQLATTIPRPTVEELQQVVAQQALLEQLASDLASLPASSSGWEGELTREAV
jgi:hypothetical protein